MFGKLNFEKPRDPFPAEMARAQRALQIDMAGGEPFSTTVVR
jgi:hypothetical protein